MNQISAYYESGLGEQYASIIGTDLHNCTDCINLAHPDSQSDTRCASCHVRALLNTDTRNWSDDEMTEWAKELGYWQACMAYEGTEEARTAWGVMMQRRAYWLRVR